MKSVICFVGWAGSGKDAACDYLVKKYGYHKINVGGYMDAKLKEKGISPTHENKSKYAKEFLKEYGNNYIINAALRDIKKHKLVAVSGVRRPLEVRAVKNIYPHAVFVGVFADEKKRAERRGVSAAKLRARDRHDARVLGLREVLKGVDYWIDNNGSKKKYCENISAVMAAINPVS